MVVAMEYSHTERRKASSKTKGKGNDDVSQQPHALDPKGETSACFPSVGKASTSCLSSLSKCTGVKVIVDNKNSCTEMNHSSLSLGPLPVDTSANYSGRNEIGDKRFRQLLLLHLDLIEQQQAKLQEKDRQLMQLKIEKEQLEARIHRMERRMTLQKKHTADDADHTESGRSKLLGQKRSLPSTSTLVPPKVKRPSSIGLSCFTITSKQCKDIGTGMYLRTNRTYLHDKKEDISKNEKEKDKSVVVPCWRIVHGVKAHARPSTSRSHDKSSEHDKSSAVAEEVDDESYVRRHQKMELDEKRRKRWDIQQLRQERMHEALKQRQKELDNKKKGEAKLEVEEKPVDTLLPSADRVMAIEISDDVPVCALGCRIPILRQREFDLPWFNVDGCRREMIQKPRSKKSRKKSSSKLNKRQRWRLRAPEAEYPDYSCICFMAKLDKFEAKDPVSNIC